MFWWKCFNTCKNISTFICIIPVSQDRMEVQFSFQPLGVSASSSHCRPLICQKQPPPTPSCCVHVCTGATQLQLQSSHWVRSLIQPARLPVMWPSRTCEDGASSGETKRREVVGGAESQSHFKVYRGASSVLYSVHRSFTEVRRILWYHNTLTLNTTGVFSAKFT